MADNQPLVTREKQHQDHNEPYPNYTLKAEFDLTEQIYQTIQEVDIQASFYHVKGHQDNKTDYNKLPFEAQLSIQADKLAEKFYGQDIFNQWYHCSPHAQQCLKSSQ